MNFIGEEMRKILLIILAFSIGINLNSVIKNVSLDNTGDYTSIFTAVNEAVEGDTILVHPGYYTEIINFRTDNISLISLEAITNNQSYIDSTIIDGAGVNSVITVFSEVENIMIRGFSITNGEDTYGGGVYFKNRSTGSLINCKIYNNYASEGGGVYVYRGPVNMEGCNIFDNSAYSGGGVCLAGESIMQPISFDMDNRNSVYNNRAAWAQDLYAYSVTLDVVIHLDKTSTNDNSHYYSDIINRYDLNHTITVHSLTAEHETINHDLYVSPTGDDDNDGLTPETAMKTIQKAVYYIASDSLAPKTVHLLAGTYSTEENNQFYPISLKSNITVKGSGRDETYIIGDRCVESLDDLYPIFFSRNQSNYNIEDMDLTFESMNYTQAFQGFFESDFGFKNLRIHDFQPGPSAIIGLADAININMTNVIMEDFETDNGGFVHFWRTTSGIFKNCIFQNATSTYEHSDAWAKPLFNIYVHGAIEFENCIFRNLTVMDDDTRLINLGYQPGLDNSNNSYSLTNCQFTGLSTINFDIIGAGSDENSPIDIINCTFSDNSSNHEVIEVWGEINLTNSIFYNNDSPYQIKLNEDFESILTIDYSLFEGGIGNIIIPYGNTVNYLDTNLDIDPLFTQGNDEDLYYSLASGSPCIDAGNPDLLAVTLPQTDLLGNQRVWNNRVDIGAYEFGAPPVSNEVDEYNIMNKLQVNVFPNPFNPTTTISFNNPETSKVSIGIYNIRGQKIRSIAKEVFRKGENSIMWDGANDKGSRVASGIYFVKIQSGTNIAVKKVMLMK